MRLLPLLLSIGLLIACTVDARRQSKKTPKSTSSVVAVYLPEYRLPADYDALLTRATDLILFSIEPKATGLHMHFSAASISTIIGRRDSLRAEGRSPGRVLVCVGGAGRSDYLAQVIRSGKNARAGLVSELQSVITRNNLDGVDIDVQVALDSAGTQELGSFLNELKSSLGRRRIVTITARPGQDLGQIPGHSNPKSGVPVCAAVVDRIHYMTYDMVDAKETRHSTQENVELAVRYITQQMNVPREKIAVGLPLYGRGIASPNEVKTYEELVREFNPSPSSNEAGGFFFVGMDGARERIRSAQESKLAGVVVWEGGQDSKEKSRSILQVLFEERAAADKSSGKTEL